MSAAIFSDTDVTFNDCQVIFHNPPTYAHPIHSWQNGWNALCTNVAHGAIHNSAERYDAPKCHEGTRVAVINKIVDWVRDFTIIQVFLWIYGPAGAGKSAIAGSVVDKCRAMGIWTVSFFFSRHAADRNSDKHLAATLAYQFCILIPEMREMVGATIEKDPAILTQNLSEQLKVLIIDPIKNVLHLDHVRQRLSASYILVIIDGLDESGNRETQKRILDAFSASESQFKIPTVFLIASRPELEIRQRFAANPLQELTIGLPLDDEYQADGDIYKFLKDKFDDIKATHVSGRHLDPLWPGEEALRLLVRKSSGQFIYASTVVKYIKSDRHRPEDRLQVVQGLLATKHDETPFAALDSLYCQILSSVDDLERVMEILSYLTLYDKDYGINESKKSIEEQLSYREGDVDLILIDMHALLRVPVEETESIDFYHASFGDFLSDKSRSREFFLDPVKGHTKLACKRVKLILEKHDSVDLNDVFRNLIYHCKNGTLSPNPSANLGERLRTDLLSIILEHPELHDLFWHWYQLKDWLKHQQNASSTDSDAARSLLHYHYGIEDNWLKHLLQAIHPDTVSALVAYCTLTSIPFKDIVLVSEILESPKNRQCNGSSSLALTDMLKLFLQTEKLDPELSVMEFRMYVIRGFVSDQERSGPYFVNDEKYTILCQRLVDWAFQRHDSSLNPMTVLEQQKYESLGPINNCLWYLQHALPMARCNKRLAEALKEVALLVLQPRCGRFSDSYEARRRADAAMASLKYVKRCNIPYLEHTHEGDIGFCAICDDEKKNQLHRR